MYPTFYESQFSQLNYHTARLYLLYHVQPELSSSESVIHRTVRRANEITGNYKWSALCSMGNVVSVYVPSSMDRHYFTEHQFKLLKENLGWYYTTRHNYSRLYPVAIAMMGLMNRNSFKFTFNDFYSMTGATSETVRRCIKELTDSNLATYSRVRSKRQIFHTITKVS